MASNTKGLELFGATLWSALDVVLGQGLRFAITVVLARLLSPEEFGTVALLALFIGIAGVFVESGFGAALIQRQDITHVDEFTVFWFNFGSAVIVALFLVLLAPTFAALYEKPVLIPLTWSLAFNIPLTALGTIHHMLLMKQLNFRPLLVVSFGATLLSGITAIVMAWRGYGVWSLAVQALVAGAHWNAAIVVGKSLAPRLRIQPVIIAPTVHLQQLYSGLQPPEHYI